MWLWATNDPKLQPITTGSTRSSWWISSSTSSAICGTVQSRRVAGVRAAVGAVVRREDAPPLRGQRVERREPHRAVQPRAAVERDQGPPLPLLVDVELDVADCHAHGGSLRRRGARYQSRSGERGRQNVALRTPVAMSSRIADGDQQPVDDEQV